MLFFNFTDESCLYYCCKKAKQLYTISKQAFCHFFIKIACLTQQFNPILRLAGFFQRYVHLRAEVRLALSAYRFFYVRTYTRTAFQQLS